MTIVLLAIGLMLASAAVYVYVDYTNTVNKGDSEPSGVVEFTIEEGESVEQIAQQLKDEGLINNTWYFRFYVSQAGLEGKLQAGSFSIPHGLSIKELAYLLQKAEFPDIWITIPEGLTTNEVAARLADSFSINPASSFDIDQFLALAESPTSMIAEQVTLPAGNPLEGFLFPDTYRFPSDATTEYVINTLISTFSRRISEPQAKNIDDSGYSVYDIVILASILERETRSYDDRYLVADILLRRMENGWALEVDATLLYHFGDWTHIITVEDLALDTPYNTRKYPGLPPTPICNPGEETIRAILDPEPNDYWYYISDAEGTLHYAETLEQHNQNISTYLQ